MNEKPDYNRLYEFIEEQAGYFTAAQAHQAGFSWERLSNSVKSGKFLRIASGVYRLAQFPHQPHEDLYYTWLLTGPHSVISHESALSFYELSDVLPSQIHVIVPRTASRRRKNIRQHTNRLASDEITTRSGLRITTVARTIADVASSGLAEEQVRQAIQEALRRGLVSQEELRTQAERRGGRARKIIVDAVIDEPEYLSTTELRDFAGLTPTRVPCYPITQQIAEKLHAYTKPRKSGESSRVKDFVDILLLADLEPISGERLFRAIQATFMTEGIRPVPASVPPPPSRWESEFRRMVNDVGMTPFSLDQAYKLIQQFLDPVLAGELPGNWDPARKSWD